MKICIINNYYYPDTVGGADICVKNIADTLTEKGHQVIVITTVGERGLKERIENEVKVYSFYPFNLYWVKNSKSKNVFLKILWHFIELFNLHSYFILKKILKEEKPDIVHVNNFMGFSVSIFAAIKRLNIPFIFTMHDYGIICPRLTLLKGNSCICSMPAFFCRIYGKYNEIFIKPASYVTAPSEFVFKTINYLTRKEIIENYKMRVVPNGIVQSKVKNINILQLRQGKYDKNRKKKILFIGMLERDKGIDFLIKYIEIKEDMQYDFIIAGKGSMEKEIQKSEITHLGKIRYVGFVKGTEKEKVFIEADCLVIPSACLEVFPTVVIEAFMYGLPVIGCNTGGIKNLVENGATGYLFEPGSTDSFEKAIKELFSDENKYLEIAENCLLKAGYYTVYKMVDNYLELYNDCKEQSKSK